MGSPTYHFNYGNVLFIILNSAIEQSITQSDSTQFTYLKEVLTSNKQKRIVILTHVPTTDRFGTAHEMDWKDTKILEEILFEYKEEKLPSSDIMVLFGHLHTLDQWELRVFVLLLLVTLLQKDMLTKSKEIRSAMGCFILRMKV